MRSVSIRSLMFLVLVLALGVAALRNADDDWAGGTLLATALLLGLAALAATHGTARGRAPRLGFVVLGGGYFAMAFLGLSEANLARLPTSRLLSYVHQRVAPQATATYSIRLDSAFQQGTFRLSGANGNATVSPTNFLAISTAPAVPATPANTWARLLPGVANYQPFSVVGHCLYTILAGLLGSAITLGMQRKSETESEGPGPSLTSP